MKKEGYWVIFTIRSGRVVEKLKAWRRGAVPVGTARRRRVRGSSGLKKLEANLRAAVRHLARVVNCNFGAGDLHVTLTYDEEHLPDTWQDQEQTAALWIRRLSRERKRSGTTAALRWITVCSERDGETGESVRRHVHAVISGEGITYRDGRWWIGGRTLEELWGLGGVYCEPLRDQADYTPLAIYLLRQAGRQADRKKWHSARGMNKPVIEETIARTGQEPRVQRGGKVMERLYEAEAGRAYVRYVAPERTGRRPEAADSGGGDRPDAGGRRGGGGRGL